MTPSANYDLDSYVLTAIEKNSDGKFQPPIEAMILRSGFLSLKPTIYFKNSGSFGSIPIISYGFLPLQ